MQERLNQYRPILAVLIVACGLMAAVTSRYDMPLFYICLRAWALLSLGCIIWMTVITRQNRRRFGRLKDSLEHIMSDAVLSLPMPSLIVRESGEVVWSNPPAKQGVFPGQELFGHNIAELVPGLDWQAESSAEGRDIVIGERHYTVFLMHSSSTKEPLTIICLVDDNDLKHYTQEYFDSRPYVLTMLIDNYSELFTDAKENERSRTMGQIEHIIETFAEENHGLVKKLDRDRFLAVVEERYMKRVIEDRFPILNAIRAVDTGDRNNATMSIGVSPMAASLHESETISRQALDMALGRGGDQVVLKDGSKIQYFGGKTQAVEKNTRVKARVKAHALKEFMNTKEKVVVMGHRLPDADSFGAAIGIYRAAKTLNKKAYIVIDNPTSSIIPLMNTFSDNQDYEADMFVNNHEAKEIMDDNTLLVVVDTNKPSITQCEDLLYMAKMIVVLDHHRQGSDTIRNSVLSYIEPYASSASEMVAEILQYFTEGIRIRNVEADSIYAGIMIDTDNFMQKTGVRTFEAAAFLRRCGADVTRVRKLFREDMNDYKARGETIRNAELFRGQFAISECPSDYVDSPTVVGAQAANELLNIVGVKASFVLTEYKGVIYISARAIDEVNVQIIMERMGGGGHLNMAGCQLETVDLEGARSLLKSTLTEMQDGGEI